MVFRGTAWKDTECTRKSLLAAHEQYLDHLREQEKLSAAGRIEASGDFLGLVMFKPISIDDVRSLLQDPAVQAGVLRIEYHRWWSSDHVLPW